MKLFTAVMDKLSTLRRTGPSFSAICISVFLQNEEIYQQLPKNL